MFDSPEAQFAISAVREAALLARRVQQEMVTDALTKGDKSPVTVGDFAAQAVVAKRLADAFPGVPLIGEEAADELRSSAGAATLDQVTHFVRMVLPNASKDDVCDWIDLGAVEPDDEYWTLDPIDGTKGFLRGDQYAVAFALIKEGEVQLGVLGCPELDGDARNPKSGRGAVLLAGRGQGAYCQAMDAPQSTWSKLRTTDIATPAEARVLRSVEKGHTNISQIDVFGDKLGIQADPVPMDSQAKYAVLAAGGGEMLLRLISPDRADYREKIWDQAAGSIIIQEAGGRVTDLDGRPLDFAHGRTLAHNRGVLATNGPLHDSALAALREIGA